MFRRALSLVLLVAVVVAGIPVQPVAAQASVSITQVTVNPDQPSPNERFTITATVQNAQGSAEDFEVTDVYVRRAGTSTDLARAEDLGTIPVGSSLDTPVTVRLENAGTYDLRLTVVGRTNSGTQRLEYPLIVRVREGGPQVAVETTDSVVGTESPVRVTVSNGEDQPIRNLRLSLEASPGDVRNDTRVLPTLAAGQAQTFEFATTPGTTESDVTATLQYTTVDGIGGTVVVTEPLNAEPLRESVRLDARVGSGARPAVITEVTNLGNAPLEDLVIRLSDGDRTIVERPVNAVPAESSRTFQLNVSSLDRATLDVTATYRTGGQPGEAQTTLDYAASPGRIQLTGIDVEREDDRIHISGSASNVGLNDVQGVVVRVVPTEGVEPARPYEEYFVGTVPASDFVSFDLYARADSGVTSVPVEVTYLTDGGERTMQAEVDVTGFTDEQPEPSGGGLGGLGSILIVGGGIVALLVVVGVGIFAYRRR
ncbi:hypothetical protein ACFQJC_11625 [Haloferax namakaokahaiae]|uniref:CARDB domain-containing protein n=1 Tax=Haloferax namakaokahaiae TaxID=1748331 RepID=A0ABD5ZG18_9EURY